MATILTCQSRDVEEEGAIVILAPALGEIEIDVFGGTFLDEQHPFATLKILHKIYDLHLPRGTAGIVDEIFIDQGAVEWKTALLKLTSERSRSPSLESSPHREGTSGGAGDWEITASMDGIFYRRPKPDHPPFVEEGEIIEKGDTLGLIEVMKTFYPLIFEDPSAPDKMEVTRILPPDGGEVKQGAPVVLAKKISSE